MHFISHLSHGTQSLFCHTNYWCADVELWWTWQCTVPRAFGNISGRPSCQAGYIHHQESHVKQTANIRGTSSCVCRSLHCDRKLPTNISKPVSHTLPVCLDVKSCHLWRLKWASVMFALSLLCTHKLQALIKICCHIVDYTALCKTGESRCRWQIAVQECTIYEICTQEPGGFIF